MKAGDQEKRVKVVKSFSRTCIARFISVNYIFSTCFSTCEAINRKKKHECGSPVLVLCTEAADWLSKSGNKIVIRVGFLY